MDIMSARMGGSESRLVPALKLMTLSAVLGTAACYGAIALGSPVGFFTILALGCALLFASTAAVNVALMWSVPEENRPMAMALSIIIIHAFGDVPSPVIIGYISDHNTPGFTFTATVTYLLVCIAFWALGWANVKLSAGARITDADHGSGNLDHYEPPKVNVP